MLQFILGAAVGAAGYWAYQKYVIGTDDDAFAEFETSSLDMPSEMSSETEQPPASPTST
jgi:hypothetical protein